ncbi:hypothetical protein [Halobacteriovorax sp.]|uniref:hypothetical protein n=1 Tax=Halobacteriovorax sp. TaxID=2020862 RepID=UPI0035678CD1
MKLILSTLLVVLSINSHAFNDLEGCFETISFNGTEVTSGPSMENSKSEVFLVENQYYRDLETFKKLNTLVVSVFNGYNEPYYGFSNIVIPVDRGIWVGDENEKIFLMNEDIMYYSSNYERIKIDFFVDANFKIKGDIIELDMFLSSVRKGMFYDFTAKIKRKDCL